MYSGSGKMLFKLKKLMSANRHLAPGVDITLLNTQFSVVTDAVGEIVDHKTEKCFLAVMDP